KPRVRFPPASSSTAPCRPTRSWDSSATARSASTAGSSPKSSSQRRRRPRDTQGHSPTLAQVTVKTPGGWIDKDVGVVEEPFVPSGFVVPLALATEQFRLEPLGPQHNDSDYEAWSSSVEHIHLTPGWETGTCPDD